MRCKLVDGHGEWGTMVLQKYEDNIRSSGNTAEQNRRRREGFERNCSSLSHNWPLWHVCHCGTCPRFELTKNVQSKANVKHWRATARKNSAEQSPYQLTNSVHAVIHILPLAIKGRRVHLSELALFDFWSVSQWLKGRSLAPRRFRANMASLSSTSSYFVITSTCMLRKRRNSSTRKNRGIFWINYVVLSLIRRSDYGSVSLPTLTSNLFSDQHDLSAFQKQLCSD